MKLAVEEMTPLPSDVRSHLKNCESQECQNALHEHELLEAAISTWKAALPAIDFRETIDFTEELDGESRALHSEGGKFSDEKPTNWETSGKRQRSTVAVLSAVIGALSLCLLLLVRMNPATVEQSSSVGIEANVTSPSTDLQEEMLAVHEEAMNDHEVEAELREFGNAYGSFMQDATNKLTDTFSVVLLEEKPTSDESRSWFSEIAEQIEEPFESTLEFFLEDSTPTIDEQTIFDIQNQNEYLGLRWSKSESLKPLFTLMFV